MNSKNKDDLKLSILESIDNLSIVQNNHFMMGELYEALNVADKIIKLAQEAKLQSIIEEQKDFINQIQLKIDEKKKVLLIKDTIDILAPQFEKLVKNNEIPEAHDIIMQFKQRFENMANLNSIPEVKKLLLEEKKLWNNYIEQQEKIKAELKDLDNQFHDYLKNNEIENAQDALSKAKNLINDQNDLEIKNQWNDYEKELLKYQRKNEISIKVENSILESLKLKNNFYFDQALSNIDSMIESIQPDDFSDCEEKLVETRKEIAAAEIKYKKLYLEFAEWKAKIRSNQNNKFLAAAISDCEKIIPISVELGMHEEEKTYRDLLEQLKKEIKEKETNIIREKELLENKDKEFRKLFRIDGDDVLLLIKEIDIEDFPGNLNCDLEEKLNQIQPVLHQSRVEVKNKIISKNYFKTASGEIREGEDERIIQEIDDKNDVLHYAHSPLRNQFEEDIKNVIVTDLIPYNFEISEIQLNGEPINYSPDRLFTKNGLELKHRIGTLAPNEDIDISYKLRQRVSRTIIFEFKDQLKIIKSHSNINKLQHDGLYEVKLPFENLSGSEIDGVFIEDIIPGNFLYFIEEPKNISPTITTDLDIGELFRWDLGCINDDPFNTHYKLLDVHYFENIKVNINGLNKEGLQNLQSGNIISALRKYKEIRTLLINNIK